MHPLLEGQLVRLEEVQPKYFSNIIEWRNDSSNNKYLNQPFLLTMELQKKWYDEIYLKDQSQGLFVVVDKENGIPFATMGWTDYDEKLGRCITGRFLVGNKSYRGSQNWKEARRLFDEYLYNKMKVKIVYSHIGIDNIASIRWHEKCGYKMTNSFMFPEAEHINGVQQKEYVKILGSDK